MNETSKSLVLPHRQPIWSLLRGKGLDIGCGPDLLKPPGCDVRGWDLPDGNAQYLEGVPDGAFDFVHSSHCLEHMVDVPTAFKNWSRVVKPGGYLVITVPSWWFYELCQPLPSRFNHDHKQCFCACPLPDAPNYWTIGKMLALAKQNGCEMIECFLELDKYDFAARGSRYAIDQTLADATAQLCYVFQKRHAVVEDILKDYRHDPSTGAWTKSWASDAGM